MYKYITQLNIPIHSLPSPHIKIDELRAALKQASLNSEKFDEYFGAQTCLLVEGKTGLYPHDVEDVLTRIFSSKRQGSQLLFD